MLTGRYYVGLVTVLYEWVSRMKQKTKRVRVSLLKQLCPRSDLIYSLEQMTRGFPRVIWASSQIRSLLEDGCLQKRVDVSKNSTYQRYLQNRLNFLRYTGQIVIWPIYHKTFNLFCRYRSSSETKVTENQLQCADLDYGL